MGVSGLHKLRGACYVIHDAMAARKAEGTAPAKSMQRWGLRTMHHLRILTISVLLGFLAACSSPQDDAAKAQERSYDAQEKVATQRLELIDQYRTCIEEASGDSLKIEGCDSYLRAAEALK
jgi:hypothetical protein